MSREYGKNKAPRSDNQEYMREWRARNGDKVAAARRRRYEKYPAKYMWRNARTRARRRGQPFTITEQDIVIPTHCPVLGLELKMEIGRNSDTSPSLDCIVPELGYIPGNIAVMSWRANRMKGAWSIDELRSLILWLETQDG